jgi:hypothetical protein
MLEGETPDDIRHIAEAVCGRCGGSLDAPTSPRPMDIVQCHDCGQRAPFSVVQADCIAAYAEFMAFSQMAGRPGDPRLAKVWIPNRSYQFRMEIQGIGYAKDFATNDAGRVG